MTEKLILSLRLISPQLFYEQLRPRYLVHDPPHPAPIPVIISIFHRWIHNSTLYPSGWDGNWMELELKYNRYQRIYKKEGEITGEKFIYIYVVGRWKKKIDPSCGKWNGSPSISLLSTHWKRKRKESHRGRGWSRENRGPWKYCSINR